jgi:hypothetical protein
MKKNGQSIGKRLPIAEQVVEKPVLSGALMAVKIGSVE